MPIESKTNLKRVTVEIKGGLGNQMFQYAAGRALSLEIGAELFLEKKLGFILDREYKRTFELDRLPTVYSTSKFRNSFPFYIDRVQSFSARKIGNGSVRGNSSNYLFERNFEYLNLSSIDFSKKSFWLSGYYQDPRYFELHKEKILEELMPPPPAVEKYLEMAKLSKSHNLIALGIRVFEESSSPSAHSKNGSNKSIADYQTQLTRIIHSVANPLILVFTTKEFDFLMSMDLPKETIFVNRERGFDNPIDKLWLLSNCQHHVFNNSTFYWWGAALSRRAFREEEQQIYCADNFLNSEIRYSDWKTF